MGSSKFIEIGIINKEFGIIKTYNNPDFFEKYCCPGNINRISFIACKNAIDKLF